MPTFKPLRQPIQLRTSTQSSYMAPRGMNTRDFSQIMDVAQAILIRNYIPRGTAELERRGGRRTIANNSVATGITMYEKFLDGIHIVGYGTSVYAVDIVTGAWTALKTDFSVNDGFDGVLAGDYFFVVNGVDPLRRFYRQVTGSVNIYISTVGASNKLTYTGETGNFSPAIILTGGTSGATATISSVEDNGTTGTLIVTAVSGSFTPGEIITDSSTGSATLALINPILAGDRIIGQTSGFKATVLESNSGVFVLGNITGTPQNGETVLSTDRPPGRSVLSSALVWNSAAVDSAPIGSVLGLVGGRLMIGRLQEDETALAYSQLDTGTNPPYAGWGTGDGVNDGGRWYYKAAGKVNAITSYGNATVVYHENGYTAFSIDSIDLGGTLSKVDTFLDAKIDEGGERGAINTEKGILSASEKGIAQLLSVGQKDVPFSQQKVEVTNDLSDAYFSDVSFEDTDIVYDNYQELVFITCAKNSVVNNLLIGYSFKVQALFEITGWGISRFVFDNGVLYGADAENAKLYRLFDGYDDDGEAISSEFVQEFNPGALTMKNNLYKMYFQGLLSDSSEIQIDLDIYKRTGEFVPSYQSWLWTATTLGSYGSGAGYNRAYNSPYGGSNTEAGLTNSFEGLNSRIHNFQRLIVKLTCTDRLPHTINYITAETKNVANIRTRNITKLT